MTRRDLLYPWRRDGCGQEKQTVPGSRGPAIPWSPSRLKLYPGQSPDTQFYTEASPKMFEKYRLTGPLN
ncbi:unnamed protein product [Boreogadus saida]